MNDLCLQNPLKFCTLNTYLVVRVHVNNFKLKMQYQLNACAPCASLKHENNILIQLTFIVKQWISIVLYQYLNICKIEVFQFWTFLIKCEGNMKSVSKQTAKKSFSGKLILVYCIKFALAAVSCSSRVFVDFVVIGIRKHRFLLNFNY